MSAYKYNFIGRMAGFSICGLIVIAAIVPDLACRDVPETTQYIELQSPASRVIASAKSQRGGAFGGDYDVTSVQIKRMDGASPAVEVLRFSHNYPKMQIQMRWIDETHLDVTYESSAQLGFRLNRVDGIEVTAEPAKII